MTEPLLQYNRIRTYVRAHVPWPVMGVGTRRVGLVAAGSRWDAVR